MPRSRTTLVADRSRIKQTESYIVVTTTTWNCFSSCHASVAVAMIQLTNVYIRQTSISDDVRDIPSSVWLTNR